MSGEVKQNLTKKATASNSCSPAYTSLGSNAAKINIWAQPFNVSRVSPSNLNVGRDVSRIDTKSADVFSLAYGKDSCKYFNTGYNLKDLYPTTNYVSNYRNSGNGFLNFITKMFGVFGIATAATSIIGSLSNLFGSKKTKNDNETKVKVENSSSSAPTVKKGATAETTAIDGAVKSSKALSDSENIDEVKAGVDKLDSSIAAAERELADIDEDIDDKTNEVLEARQGEEKAEKAVKTIDDSVKIKDKESQKLNDAFEKAKDDESSAMDAYTNASSKYDKAKLALNKMQTSDPGYADMKAKVDKLYEEKVNAKQKYEEAVQTRIKAHKTFGEAAAEVEKLKQQQEKIHKIYEKRKSITTTKENELKALQTSKSKLPAKIQKAKNEKIELENRLEALQLGKDIELGLDEENDEE